LKKVNFLYTQMIGLIDMTTTVKIEAHCEDSIQVAIIITESGKDDCLFLQNGESTEIYVHDDKQVSVYEMPKK
jgi:hypothetical protein